MVKFRTGDRVVANDMAEPGVVIGYNSPGMVLVVDALGRKRSAPEDAFEKVSSGPDEEAHDPEAGAVAIGRPTRSRRGMGGVIRYPDSPFLRGCTGFGSLNIQR